jgi:hypothetical protein
MIQRSGSDIRIVLLQAFLRMSEPKERWQISSSTGGSGQFAMAARGDIKANVKSIMLALGLGARAWLQRLSRKSDCCLIQPA